MTPFDDWLRELRAAAKGPITIYATRGRAYNDALTISGDFSGATLRGQIRLTPDAAGSALASFTVDSTIVAAGETTFLISLSAAQTAALPAANLGEGVTTLAYDFLMTPADGDEELLVGGAFELIGRVTA